VNPFQDAHRCQRIESESLVGLVRGVKWKLAFQEDAPVSDECHNVLRMPATKPKKVERSRTRNKAKPEPPWNVLLHNDWNNSMPRVVIVLKKVVPGMTLKKATKIMLEAHRSGQALVKSCHKELAEFYMERLQQENLTVSIEPAG
jgi:ATP-dependent Clp protease adaptor protein ClpS